MSGTQKFALMFGGMILIGIALMRISPVNGQQNSSNLKVQDIIQAHTVEIVDPSGKICARFGFVPGGSLRVNSVPRLTLDDIRAGTQSLLLPQEWHILDKPTPGQRNIDSYALVSLEGHHGNYTDLRLKGTDGKARYQVILPGKPNIPGYVSAPGDANPVIYARDENGIDHIMQPTSKAFLTK